MSPEKLEALLRKTTSEALSANSAEKETLFSNLLADFKKIRKVKKNELVANKKRSMVFPPRLVYFTGAFLILVLLLLLPRIFTDQSIRVLDGVLLAGGQVKSKNAFVVPGTHFFVEGKNHADLSLDRRHLIRFKQGEYTVSLSNGSFSVEVYSGKIYVVVRKIGPSESFALTTSNAFFRVTGTRFVVEETGGETYLCVCEGSVEAGSRGWPKKKVAVIGGQDLFLAGDAPAKDPVDSPDMKQMGDMVFEMMRQSHSNLFSKGPWP